MSDLHHIQMVIIRTLLFNPKARFSELNPEKVPSDQFNFHIKRLVDLGFIIKSEDKDYELTTKGKEFANRLDTDTSLIEKQAKLGVVVCCVREINGQKEYLMQQRLKQPYYGYYGFITGKIRWGETVIETAERELLEESGLKGEVQLAGIKHKMDYSQNNELLEDKFFYVIRVVNPIGELISEFEGGKNIWCIMDEIKNLSPIFPDVETTLKMIDNKELLFTEKKFLAEGF